MLHERHPVDRASDAVGGAKELARRLGVTEQAISNWKGDGRSVPIERCVQIERETLGTVTRQDLRADWADIWPELAEPRKAGEKARAA